MLVKRKMVVKTAITIIAVLLISFIFTAVPSHAATFKYKATVNTSNKTITRELGQQTLYISSTKELIVSMYGANGTCLWSSDWSNANVAPNTCRTFNVGNNVVKIKVRTTSGVSTVRYSYN